MRSAADVVRERFKDGLPLLLPYQQPVVLDDSPAIAWSKARRIGMTWADAADSVLRAGQGVGDCWYQTYDEPSAAEYVVDCAQWARRFQAASEPMREYVVKDEDKDVRIFEIRFASGKRIRALSSVPRVLRGKGRPGDKYTGDEVAFMDNFDEILKAVTAFTTWGGTIRLFTTENADGPWAEFSDEIRAGRHPEWKLYEVYIDQAIADGLGRRIASLTGKPYAGDEEFRRRLFALYRHRDAAAEELLGIRRRSGDIYLERRLIEGAMIDCPVVTLECDADLNEAPRATRRREIDSWIEDALKPQANFDVDRRHAAGFDFARRAHMSVLSTVEIGADRRLRSRLQVEMHNVPHDQQRQVCVWTLKRLPRFAAVFADATGAGSYLAEALEDEFGSRAEPIDMSLKWWREQMPRYRAALEDRAMLIPDHDDVLTDHRAVRVIDGVPRLPKRVPGGRHGDSLVSSALARQAAAEGRSPVAGVAAMPRAAATRFGAWETAASGMPAASHPMFAGDGGALDRTRGF